MPSGWTGASGMACAAHASDNPNKAIAIVLTIVSSRYPDDLV
jgi:hypothetical protein